MGSHPDEGKCSKRTPTSASPQLSQPLGALPSEWDFPLLSLPCVLFTSPNGLGPGHLALTPAPPPPFQALPRASGFSSQCPERRTLHPHLSGTGLRPCSYLPSKCLGLQRRVPRAQASGPPPLTCPAPLWATSKTDHGAPRWKGAAIPLREKTGRRRQRRLPPACKGFPGEGG